MTVGRRRTKNLRCPAGVREVAGRWYWQPTSARERKERKLAGLPGTVPLGVPGEEARRKWAVLAGYTEEPTVEGTVNEVLALFETSGLVKKPNGRPRSGKTVKEYTRSIVVLRKRFGACRYGKTEFEASRGQALGTVDVQRFISDDGRPVANRHASVLSAAFAFAILRGRTTYNPCAGIVRTHEEPRDREPQPWEVECLRAVAYALKDALLPLFIDYEEITGWRVSDIRLLVRPQLTVKGVKLRAAKRGRRQLWEWSPELRRIVADAGVLPGAKIERLDQKTRAPLPRYVFPTNRGEPLTLDAFEKRWAKLKRRTNTLLAECVVPLRIDDLHFHDLRSKAGDDAEEQGQNRADFLGVDRAVADDHYARREKKVRPTR